MQLPFHLYVWPRPPHPSVTLTQMSDDHDDDQPTPTDLEQLARSISMDGSVGRHDAQVIAEALRRLPAMERAHQGQLWRRHFFRFKTDLEAKEPVGVC